MADTTQVGTFTEFLNQFKGLDPEVQKAALSAINAESRFSGTQAVVSKSNTGKERLEFQENGKMIYLGRGNPAVIYPGLARLIVQHLDVVKEFEKKTRR